MAQPMSTAAAAIEAPPMPTIIDEEEIHPIDVLFYGSSPKIAHKKHAGTTAFQADLHRFVDEFQQCPAYLIAKELVRHVQKEYGKGSRFLKRVEFADANQFGLAGWRNKWLVLDTTAAFAKVEKMVMRIQTKSWKTTNLNAGEATDYTKAVAPIFTGLGAKNGSSMPQNNDAMNGDADTDCTDANACNGSASNDNSSGVLYVSFVGGHPSNPILRVPLSSGETCDNNGRFDLPYTGPNEASEAAELSQASLKQANIVDVKPLPPRSSLANTNANAHTSIADDDSRAQRHRARKNMIKAIYHLLKNQPVGWPEQWKEWFTELPRNQLTSFVAKVEHMLYKRSKSFDAHIEVDSLPERLYVVLTELENKRRKLVSADRVSNETDTHAEPIDKAPNDADADGRLTPSNSFPEESPTHDSAAAEANTAGNNNQTNAMHVDCSLDVANAFGSDGISPQSVMEDISQRQPKLVCPPHPQQAFFPQTHDIPTTLNNFPHSPKTAHAFRRIAEKGSEVAAFEEEQWWNSNFNTLLEFQQQWGTEVLHQPSVYANPHLGSWINDQRKQHDRKLKGLPHTMSDDRELKLNAVGFSLSWSSRELASKALAEESAKRADEYCRVSDEFSSLNFVVMCRRLANFQVACMEGRQSPMDLKVQAWVAYMKDMQEKKQAGKSCELSDAMEYSLFRLGIDIPLSKEVQAKIVDGSIHQERISLFTGYAMPRFNATEKWRFMFDELAAFKQSQGNFLVSSLNNATLYGWMRSQRKKHRDSKLTEEQFHLLHQIRFDWQGPGRWGTKL